MNGYHPLLQLAPFEYPVLSLPKHQGERSNSEFP